MNVLILGVGDSGLDDSQSETVNRLEEYARRVDGKIRLVVDSPRRGTFIHGRLTVIRTGSARVCYLRAIRNLIPEILHQGVPDLITSQDPFATAFAGLWLRRTFQRPLLIQNHSSFLFNAAWMKERLVLFGILHQLARFCLPRADGWRVVNSRERDIYVHRLGLPAGRVRVLPVPCDISPFAEAAHKVVRLETRKKWGEDAHAPVVIWAGRMVRVKRLPMLMRAFAEVRKRIPSVRLWLCGDQSTDRELVERMAKQAGVVGAVRCFGPLPRVELAALVSSADVFALTSAYEGFGRVLVEAGAAGIPAVSTATAGAAEIIVDGETGFLSPVEGHGLFAEKLVALLRDAELRSRMGAAAIERIHQRYNPDRAFDAIIDQWREVTALRIAG